MRGALRRPPRTARSEAAFRVGYHSASQFSRAYRRMLGAPPGLGRELGVFGLEAYLEPEATVGAWPTGRHPRAAVAA